MIEALAKLRDRVRNWLDASERAEGEAGRVSSYGETVALFHDILAALDAAVTPPQPLPDGPIGDLLAYGQEESTNALKAKDRDAYQFWQGWTAALSRVSGGAAVTHPPGQPNSPIHNDEKSNTKDARPPVQVWRRISTDEIGIQVVSIKLRRQIMATESMVLSRQQALRLAGDIHDLLDDRGNDPEGARQSGRNGSDARDSQEAQEVGAAVEPHK